MSRGCRPGRWRRRTRTSPLGPTGGCRRPSSRPAGIVLHGRVKTAFILRRSSDSPSPQYPAVAPTTASSCLSLNAVAPSLNLVKEAAVRRDAEVPVLDRHPVLPGEHRGAQRLQFGLARRPRTGYGRRCAGAMGPRRSRACSASCSRSAACGRRAGSRPGTPWGRCRGRRLRYRLPPRASTSWPGCTWGRRADDGDRAAPRTGAPRYTSPSPMTRCCVASTYSSTSSVPLRPLQRAMNSTLSGT